MTALESVNRVNVDYIGVSKHSSRRQHWGQRTGLMLTALGSVDTADFDYTGVSEEG